MSKSLLEALQLRRRVGEITNEEYQKRLKVLQKQFPELKAYLSNKKNRGSLKIA
jgi:hypothetical protein